MATIENDRDNNLRIRGASARVMNPRVEVSSTSTPVGYSNFIGSAPTSILLTVTSAGAAGNYTSPTYKWEYSKASTPNTWVDLAVSTSSYSVTNANFTTHRGTDAYVNYRVMVSQPGWSTLSSITTLTFYSIASAVPVITFTREAILLPTTSADVVDYSNSGCDIRVSIAGTPLTYAASGNNTFDVTTTTSNITVGTASTVTVSTANDTRRFGNLSGMGAGNGSASVTFTINIRDAGGILTTVTKVQTIAKATQGSNGSSGVVLDLSNDSFTVATASDGTGGTYGTQASTTLRVYMGGTDDSANWTFTGVATNATGTLGGGLLSTPVVGSTTLQCTNLTQDNGFITITAARSGYSSLTGVFSGSKSKSGVNSTVYYLTALPQVIKRDSSNVYTPTSITFLAYASSSITAPFTGYWKWYVDNGSGFGAATNAGPSNSYVYTPSGGTLTQVKVELYTDAGYTNLVDTEVIPIVADGGLGTPGNSTRTITVYNNSGTVPTAPTGGTYNFQTGAFVLPTGGGVTWQASQPNTTTVATYSTTATVTGQGDVATPFGTWSTPIIEAQNGAPGTTNPTIVMAELYLNNNGVPTAPTSVTYNISTNTVSAQVGGTAGWVSTPPGTPSLPLATYMTRATVSSTTPGTNVTGVTGWSTPVVYAQAGTNGSPGAEGTKSRTISAYAWTNTGSAPTVTTTGFTYTWSTGAVSAYPPSYTSSAGTAPGTTGYTLYQIDLTISDVVSATTTAGTWATANIVSNIIGYRNDGTIGPTGASGVRAYQVISGASLPANPAVPSGAPTVGAAVTGGGWYTQPKATLGSQDWMFIADGTLTSGTYSWPTSTYLASFKVGQLSAISADMGNVSISSTGSIFSAGKSYADNVNGFYLGYNGGVANYVFQLGASNGPGITWDGSTFTVRGTGGAAILTSGNTAAQLLNSSITLGSDGTLSGGGGGAVTAAGINAVQTSLGNAPSGILNSTIAVNASGQLTGIGTGANTTVANSQIAISGGLITGIGTGNNTAVANSAISINANGTLTGAGSGQVSAAGLNALLKNAADTLSGTVTLGSTTALIVGNTTTGMYLGSTGLFGVNAGSTKFAITSDGNATFNGTLGSAAILTGQVNVGSFTGNAWPAAGLTGAHLSGAALLMGNPNGSGKYFQVDTGAGNPANASINTNIPFINTVNVNANQVSQVYTGSSTTTSVTISITVPSSAGALVFSINPGDAYGVFDSKNSAYVTYTSSVTGITVNGTAIGPVPHMLNPTAGTYNVVITRDKQNSDGTTTMSAAVIVFKR